MQSRQKRNDNLHGLFDSRARVVFSICFGCFLVLSLFCAVCLGFSRWFPAGCSVVSCIFCRHFAGGVVPLKSCFRVH